MPKFSKEEIGFVRVFLQRSPKDFLKKEADEIIEFLQSEVSKLDKRNAQLAFDNNELTREADNRVQSLADQLAEAQQKCNDYMLKASI